MPRADTQFGGPRSPRPGRPPLTADQRAARELLALKSLDIVKRALDIALNEDAKTATPVLLKLLDKLTPDLLDEDAMATLSPFAALTVAELQALARAKP